MTAARATEFSTGHAFLESPRWHGGELWLSDFYRKEISSISADGTVSAHIAFQGQPSGLGWLPDGDLIAVSMLDRLVVRLDSDGTWHEHADLSGYPGFALNDMVVDACGRAYVGDLGFNPWVTQPRVGPAPLIMVEPDGSSRMVADGLYLPNGCAITPDGSTLLVGETFGNRISAFDIESDGSLGSRRDWASWGELESGMDVPSRVARSTVGADGAALDAAGGFWIADCFHHRLVRVVEGGVITDDVSFAPDQVFAVELGGPDGHTLYVCVAPNPSEDERRSTRLGRVLTLPTEHAAAAPTART